MPSNGDKKKRLTKDSLYRALKWTAIVVVLYAVLGFLALPPLVKHFGARGLSEAMGRNASIESIRINPFLLTLTARGVTVAEADGATNAFSLGLLHADLELASLVRGGPVLRELRLESPALTVVRLDAERLSWTDVIERLAARPASSDDEPALFSVNNIRLTDGSVVVEDRLVDLRHEISGLTVAVPFVSNLPVKIDLFVEPELSALVNGRPLRLAGRTRPFRSERDTALDLQLDDFDFTPYLAYLPFERRFAMPEGRISAKLELAFAQPEEGVPEVALKGAVEIASLRLQDAAGAPMLSLPRLALALADVQPLVGRWHFDNLDVESPEIDLVRDANGTLNFATIVLPPAPAPVAAEAAPQGPGSEVPGGSSSATETPQPSFALAQLHVRGGTLRFEDHSRGERGPGAFRTRLDELAVEASGLSNAHDAVAALGVSFSSDAGEKFAHDGRLRLAPFILEGRATAEGVQVPRYAPYYAAALPGGDIRGGIIDAIVDYRFALAEAAPEVTVNAESLALRDFALALAGRKEPALRLSRMSLGGVSVTPAQRSVAIEALNVAGASVGVVRGRDGTLDLAGLVAAAPAASGKEKVADGEVETAQWKVSLKRFAVGESTVRFEDRTQERPIVMLAEGIRLSGEDFSSAKGTSTRVELSARVNKRGRAAVTGSVGIDPLKGELRLDLSDVDLLPLQPYVVEQLNISISRGRLSSRSAVRFDTARGGAIRARVRGNLRVADFASIDKLQATDFVRWRSLAVEGVDVRTEPFSLAVSEVALDDFYSRLILDEQGQLNLRELRVQPEAPEAEAAAPTGGTTAKGEATLPPPAPAPPISIGTVTVSGGNIAFSDRFIRPNYDANLTEMQGELIGLSSDPSTVAKLNLQGSVDNAAPVTVAGELNPFRQDRYLKIAASVKDFELPAISAYSGKYVGYGIEKGKLSAEVNYSIEERRLTATNRVFLDQLTFGDKIDSPDAVQIPVRLAVALLKNGRGEINLDVPVGGSLDDPEFSVGGLVVRAFLNLIGKALVSPFALLGSVFGGGGAELSYLEFAPGRADFLPPAQEKLATLARALADRPALKLEIAASADPVSDPAGIRRERLTRRVKAAWLRERVGKGEAVPSIDALQLEPEQYAETLREIYRDAEFERPRNAIGLLRELPVPEMEALMLENIGVDEAALRQLAQRRGQTVKDHLLTEGGISAERIFLLAPKVEEPSANDNAEPGAGRRARFSLR